MKICPGCSTAKAEADFNRDASRRDGLKIHCRTCQQDQGRDYYQKHRNLVRAKRTSRYWRNQAIKARTAA